MKYLKKTAVAATFAITTIASPALAQSFSAGIDLNYLGLSHSEGQVVGFGFTAAPEVWVELQSQGGLIYGLRAFRLEADSADPTTRYDNIVMQTIDLSIGKSFSMGSNTEGKVFGGMRFAKYYEQERGITNGLTVPKSYGLLGGIEIVQQMSNNLSLYGGSTAAIMFAPDYTDIWSTLRPDIIVNGTDLTFNTIDLNLGLRYKRQLANGGNWHAGLGLTSKLWNGVSDGDSENISGYGFKLSFGMDF